MSEERKYVRKQYLIDKEMQTYHLKVWFISAVVVIITIAVFFFFFKLKPATAKDTVILHNLYIVLTATAAFIILYSVFMGLHAMLHSHKIAGAAYNIERSIRKFKEKDFQHRVRLRKGDYLQGIAQALNEMVNQFQEDREELASLLEKLENLEGFPEEGKELVAQMKKILAIPE